MREALPWFHRRTSLVTEADPFRIGFDMYRQLARPLIDPRDDASTQCKTSVAEAIADQV